MKHGLNIHNMLTITVNIGTSWNIYGSTWFNMVHNMLTITELN